MVATHDKGRHRMMVTPAGLYLNPRVFDLHAVGFRGGLRRRNQPAYLAGRAFSSMYAPTGLVLYTSKTQ